MNYNAELAAYKECFFADLAPPSGEKTFKITQASDPILTENPGIYIQFQDIVKAMKEAQSLEKPPEDKGVVSYFLGLRDARFLCCHLIHALADSNDPLAQKLVEVMTNEISEYENDDQRNNCI